MDMNLALPFITTILFKLDRYRAVTRATAVSVVVVVCMCVWEDMGGEGDGVGEKEETVVVSMKGGTEE